MDANAVDVKYKHRLNLLLHHCFELTVQNGIFVIVILSLMEGAVDRLTISSDSNMRNNKLRNHQSRKHIFNEVSDKRT